MAAGAGALSAAGLGLSGCATQSSGDALDGTLPSKETGKAVEARVDLKTGEVTPNEDVITRFSACLGCYSCCEHAI